MSPIKQRLGTLATVVGFLLILSIGVWRASGHPATPLTVFVTGILVPSGTLGLLMIAIGIFVLTYPTGMLRDPPAADIPQNAQPPFSLSRMQMFVWLFTILGGFIFIWFDTGQYNGVVKSSTFALMGIQGATGLAGVLIQLTPSTAAAPVSKGFWRDISSTTLGPQLHRIQLILWTIVLVAIFLWSTLTRQNFPDFDANLMILAGIVNGMYIGFKWPEVSK